VAGDRENTHEVVSLMDEGFHGEHLAAAGVPVHALGMPRGRITVRGLARLYRIIRQRDPDVVQTWMYHADLIGGVLARLAGKRAVVWGIRNAYLNPMTSVWSTRAVARACALLSGTVPARIVSCSVAGARAHTSLGYSAAKMTVIANGYDVERLAPDEGARGRLRREWGVEPDVFLVGMVARWDAQKDHATLLHALGLLQTRLPMAWRCILVGPDMTPDNRTLMTLLEAHCLHDRVLLLGPRSDVTGIMSALDLHVLSSVGEAFPNVVAEAMACGTPCLVTDVGDAAMMVGATGWVVPPRDPQRLADGVATAAAELADPARRQRLQAAARARVSEEFGLPRMVSAYGSVWREARHE
jgi:glycosyltransferase involved in cell wall biosynthesis